MRTFDEAMAVATDKPAFSNGAEGYDWMSSWCEHCRHYADCPIMMVAMADLTPAEWVEQSRASLGDRYRCTEFEEVAA